MPGLSFSPSSFARLCLRFTRGVAVVLGTAWCVVTVLTWWFQERLIFPGWDFTVENALPAGCEHLELPTDGILLAGGLCPAAGPSRGLLLAFGGNGDDVVTRLHHLRSFAPDFDVAGVNYRGYGSSGGVPSEAAITSDARLIRDRLVERIRPKAVVAIGFSLGTGVAARLAADRPLQGVILVTPYDSVAAVARETYPFLPVNLLIRHPFRSDHALAGVDVPTAVLAGTADTVIPPDRTRALLQVIRNPVLTRWFEGAGHGSIYGHPQYRATVRAALDLMTPQLPAIAGRTD